ncbi:MAG: alpha/beta hydrolase [Nocardiaceae bacterium]|nr:alpha/beta hydrolase [Nocardiaceae bacterium]
MPTANVNGAELYYEELGSGPPLLLMLGTGACMDLWTSVFERLAHTYRVIAYDRRGFGRSASAPRGKFSDHTRDAAALLAELEAAPATVVGWSGGGAIAVLRPAIPPP